MTEINAKERLQANPLMAKKAIEYLIHHKFVSAQQAKAMQAGMKGEEGQYFMDKAEEMAKLILGMPKTYDQDGKGDSAIAYLHYFKGGNDWYITEKDMGSEQHQAFGFVNLRGGYPELGYISIVELADHNVELDLHWTPTTIGELKKKHH